MCAGGCDLHPTSVEVSTAAEQQHYEDDDEQRSRVHSSTPVWLASYPAPDSMRRTRTSVCAVENTATNSATIHPRTRRRIFLRACRKSRDPTVDEGGNAEAQVGSLWASSCITPDRRNGVPGDARGILRASFGAAREGEGRCCAGSQAEGTPAQEAITFAGFRSRCTTPFAWAAVKASSSAMPKSSTRASGRLPCAKCRFETLPLDQLHREEAATGDG
jgi:hypothetical protein